MILSPFTALIRRRVAACLLVLVVLGQLAVGAHAFEHGVADQPDRCATCVHLDQGSQAPSSAGAIPVTPFVDARPDFDASGFEPPANGAHFDARAPPQ